MSDSEIKKYDNGELVITWQAEKCIHSGKCVMGLPKVFKPKQKPWIEIENASTEELVSQIKKCPSAALGYYFHDQKST